MQKILSKLSGSSGEPLGDSESICLLGSKEKFPVEKLLQALKTASQLSAKSGTAATLVLPPSALTITSSLQIDGNIELVGQLNESRTVLNFTKNAGVALSPNSTLKMDKLKVCLQKAKPNSFEISSGSKLEIAESSIEVEGDSVAFRVEGALEMKGCEIYNSLIEIYETGQLDLDGCKFAGYETNKEISAISFFGGAEKNLIASCEFKDCANAVMIDGQKIKPCVEVIGTDFQCSKAAIIGVAAELSLHKVKSSSGFKFSEGSVLSCKDAEITLAHGENAFQATDSNLTLENTNVTDAVIGVLAKKCTFKVRQMKIFQVKKEAMNLTDCDGTIYTVHVNNQNTKKDGIHIIFQESTTSKINLADCKSQNCTIGVRVEDKIRLSKSAEENHVDGGISFVPEKRNRRRNKSVLENCSFIKCQMGLSLYSAKVSAKGCSFIMSGKHSFFLEGLNTLKVRWPNYVEPFIDNTTALSNNSEILADATIEKLFCGSSEFEPSMYLPTLTERLRQARNVFRSKEHNCELKARVIMKSVSHMLVLLRKLMTPLIERELLEDPNLGMFAATFKLEEPERPSQSKNIVPMDLLLESWKSLSKTKLFDDALFALNEAFERKQVEEEVYDEIVSPLEEMQRTCFVNSKFNRRRDYLLQTAKENPLSAWFFLDKEDRNTQDGIRLREEVLKFLASEVGETGVVSSNFHASWVAQWAVRLLGDDFLKTEIPESLSLRKAWADKLLDNGQGKLLLEQYKNKEDYKTPVDQLFRFEAYRQIEAQGETLTQDQHKKVSELFEGQGYAQAIRVAAKEFKGEGTLPGFLRREAEKATSAESLLEILSHANEDNQQTRYKKKQVVLAVMSHFLNRDDNEMPKIPEQKNHVYKACPTCMVQKLQPWNALCLKDCQGNHRVCKLCMKTSMSTGAIDLWGKCPGVIDGGKPCPAVATRREMEMAGMETEKIYNILENRVTRHLHALPGWKSCDNVGCIGGRSHVKKEYYTCWLCTKVVTLDGGKGDPTVARKLLLGFQESKIPRGEGSVRECYHCGVIYEKGNACSTITCSACSKDFNMTFGPDQINHKFDENGIGPQRYVPKQKGKLWELGVYKTKKGQDLELGAKLNESEAQEVVRRCKVKLETLDG